MLKIWYYANIEYMKDAPSYFDNVYEDEWIEDSFVKEMIQDVDHCTVISSHVIDSPILGAITPRELSGGVKVLILMLKDDSFIYNMAKKYDCAFVDNEMPYGRVPQGHPVIVDYFYHEEIRGTENTGKRNR